MESNQNTTQSKQITQLQMFIDKIQKQKKGINNINHLRLTNLDLIFPNKSDNKQIEKCMNLKVLELVDCQIQNVSELPQLDNLLFISLSRNRIGTNDNHNLQKLSTKYPQLIQIDLSFNELRSVEQVNDFHKSIRSRIKSIDYTQNKFMNDLLRNRDQYNKFRKDMFELCTELDFLNGFYKYDQIFRFGMDTDIERLKVYKDDEQIDSSDDSLCWKQKRIKKK